MKHPNILLVDDDKNFLRVLSYQVEESGFRTTPTPSGREALKRLDSESFDLVITDLKMPGMDGIELLAMIRARFPDLPVIVLTAFGSIDGAVEAIKLGAFDFLTKPFEGEEMRHTIANALKISDLLEENRRLSEAVSDKFEFKGIVGSSKALREVLDLAAQLAGVDTTVLIQGESGTGKEILARAIHFNGRRQGKPFIVVNCGAIPENLMESELFGHKKGAFTGAVSDRKGKFEVADSGTVFLDEVSELPASMQVKLLRVVQEREIDVIGDANPRAVDVRILAATNRDLEQMIREKTFREDLYYRLAVAPLWIPPLRKRREDIPLLVHYFLEHFSQKFDKRIVVEPQAFEALQSYDWPGNVRELENVVERLIVFDRRRIIRKTDLPAQFQQPIRTFGRVMLQLPEEGFSLEELEKELVLWALERHDWNQTRAARYLGITRNTLIYRMQKFDLKLEQGTPTAGVSCKEISER